MAKPTYLDWQKDSVLLARGEPQGNRLVREGLRLEPFTAAEGSDHRDPAGAVRRAAESMGCKGPATVILARELVEMRTLQIPHMDADDLPDVIRFQALRQWSGMTDAWVVDFVLLPQAPGQEMQTALVAALAPSHLAEIEKACSAAGLQVEHLLLRPLEIARAAVRHARGASEEQCVVLCVAQQTADILLLKNGQVVLVRTTRLPADPAEMASALSGEIRRSLLAGASELSGVGQPSMVLIAPETECQNLTHGLRQSSQANVDCLPLESLIQRVGLSEGSDPILQTAGSRLAGIAGAASPSRSPHTTLDFKHPKKRPPKKRDLRRLLLMSGAAAALLLLVVGWYFSRLSRLNSELQSLATRINGKSDLAKAAESRIAELRALERFLDASPNWLDELACIVERMPDAGQIKLESPSFTVNSKGEGVISLIVKANDAAAIAQFEDSLRDANHIVSGAGASQLTTPDENYYWRASSSITVSGRGWKVEASSDAPSKQSDGPRPSAISTESAPANRVEGGKHDAT